MPADDGLGTVRCYRLSEDSHSFTECQSEICGPMGSTLACVRSEDENNRIHELLSTENAKNGEMWGAWIGFHEGKAEGDWAWTSTCNSDYTRWHPGEPNDYCVDEDCTMMAPELWGRQWVDASCELDAYCLCEHDLKLSPEYTEDIIVALKSNSADYDACKEEEKALKEIKKSLNGWKFLRMIVLLSILASNIVILITVRKHLTISGSKAATRTDVMEQPLLPTRVYDSLNDEEGAVTTGANGGETQA